MNAEPMLEAPEAGGTVTFEVEDVTGTQCFEATFESDLPASAVARVLTSDMSLPTDVPWALRNNRSCAFLEESVPIGQQVKPADRLTVTPKSRLGGR